MCQIRRKKCERNCLHFKKAVGKSTFLNSKKLPQIQLFSSLCLRCKQMQSLVAVCDYTAVHRLASCLPGFEQKSTSAPEDERWRLSVLGSPRLNHTVPIPYVY